MSMKGNIFASSKKFPKIALASIIAVNTFLIIHAPEVKAAETLSLSQISSLNEKTITNGIGGRAILNNTGAILTTKVALPEIKDGSSFKAEGGTLYVYSGFSGQVESDIGFQYSTTYNVWKPIVKVGNRGQETVQYIEGKDNFTYTLHLSSCCFVGCFHLPQSHSYLCSWGCVHLPPRCKLKSIGYIQMVLNLVVKYNLQYIKI
ncbi:conserved hypothetical protein [Photorhabdus asymbiotica]|uniref:Uncharacterized protein n=2 Tax=Photorhabdus asymbiotica TaxID=291112 RepID=C7BHM9_PHOAA|nr:conserved hypothetical protein [Photorhabdus asymbiotica]